MSRRRKALASFLIGLVLTAGTSGCVYRIDLQQGNVVTQDMINRLEPGMDQREVLFIMGTPLITAAFDPDHWDYVYTFQPGGGERVQRYIALIFSDGRLVRIEGDIEAAASQEAEPGERPETVVTVPEGTPDRGFWGWFGGDESEERRRAESPTPEPPEGRQAPAPESEGLELGT